MGVCRTVPRAGGARREPGPLPRLLQSRATALVTRRAATDEPRARQQPGWELDLDPIGSCQASTPQSGSKSAPFRQTPQTMLRALRMQWPRAFILLLPAARLRA